MRSFIKGCFVEETPSYGLSHHHHKAKIIVSNWHVLNIIITTKIIVSRWHVLNIIKAE